MKERKTFPILLEEKLHRMLKHAAIDEGMSLQDWIINVLREKVTKSNRFEINNTNSQENQPEK